MKTQQTLSIIVAGVLLVGSFFAGIFVGREQIPEVERVFGLHNKTSEVSDLVDFEPFWRAWNLIEDEYVSAGNGETSGEDRVWGAISGLVDSLGDPYSVFLPPAESEAFEEDIRGNFSGVGIEIGVRDGALSVVAPLKGTPAERSGVRPGDHIIRIDGTSTSDMSIDEAVDRIRGEQGTVVILTLLRDGKSSDVSIVRDTIVVPVTDTELREDGIFVISLFNFNANSPRHFRDGVRDFVLSGSDRLIIDLRGNPGGFLQASIDVASWFLPAGKTIVRSTSGGDEEETVYRSKGYNVISKNVSVVVLVDRGSASASEIVAGALKEHGIATLVGTRTFGKGSVQQLLSVTDNTELRLTTAQWLTPNGNSISNGGLEPDVLVELSTEDIENGRDPQFEKAVEILLSS